MTERFGGKEVVFAGDPAQAEMICDLLDAEGIDAEIRDAGVGGMIPYLAAAGGAGAVKVVVAPEDAGRARELLDHAAEFRDEHTDPGNPEAPTEIEAAESAGGTDVDMRRRGRAQAVAWIWLSLVFGPLILIGIFGFTRFLAAISGR